VWHTHEPFLVAEGRLATPLRGRDVLLGPGRLVVVPHGVEHRPQAEDAVKALRLEPAGVASTGAAGGDLAVVVEAR
jgi:mannose-6-phosphate isomerase-like protein (cupin superfamily)